MNTTVQSAGSKKPVVIIDPNKPFVFIESSINRMPPVADDQIEEAEIVEETPSTQPQTKCLHVEEDVYLAIAEKMCDYLYEFSGGFYATPRPVKTDVECEYGGIEYVFSGTLFVYFKRVTAPDGEWPELSDVSPIWWELHSYNEDGEEVLNDATFDQLKKYIIY